MTRVFDDADEAWRPHTWEGEAVPGGPGSSPCIVAMNPSGSRRPIFGVHNGGGTPLSFGSIAEDLGRDQPFYGIQQLGVDGSARPHDTIEAMAAHYLREVAGIQPRGPYQIAGLCFGAFVAIEMAQQLVRRGEEVTLLAAFNPQSTAAEVCGDARTTTKLIEAATIAEAAASIPVTSPGYVRAWDRLTELLEELGMTAELLQTGMKNTCRYLRILAANHHAFLAYEPVPYSGDAVLYLSTVRQAQPLDQVIEEWEGLVKGEVRVKLLEADEGSIYWDGNVTREIALDLRQVCDSAA